MEELLITYGSELLTWLNDAVAFGQEQIPLFVEEILAFGTFKLTIWIITLSIISASLIGGLIALIKVSHDDADDDLDGEIAFLTLLIIVAIVFLVLAITNLYMIKIAPRLYLIQQIKKIL